MFKRYSLIKTLTKNFNILSDANADADADAGVTAIALPVLSYRRAKNVSFAKLTIGNNEIISAGAELNDLLIQLDIHFITEIIEDFSIEFI